MKKRNGIISFYEYNQGNGLKEEKNVTKSKNINISKNNFVEIQPLSNFMIVKKKIIS